MRLLQPFRRGRH